MSNLKKLILTFFIIVIVIIIIIFGIIYFNRGEIVYNIDEIGSEEELYNFDTSIQYVTTRNDFYAVQMCVQKFYTYYAAIFDKADEDNYELEENDEILNKQNEQALYNMLDSDYISYKNITLNNISSKVDKLYTSVININKMYVSQKSTNMYVYIIQGKLREKKTGKISDFELLIKLDALNKTFTVCMDDYIEEKYSDLKLGQEININMPEEIEKKDINIYEYNIINDETYVEDLLAKYKEEVLFDKETAYEHLDEQYKINRFGEFSEFQLYLKDNIKNNVVMKATKYQKTKYDNYTEYVCIDQNDNYYIFNETAVMNYNLILDTYTVNLPEFNEKYDNGTDQVRVGMNIEKIITAINSKDYRYVFNKLDSTFKNNYFNDLNEFIKYIQNNYYDNNKVNYEEFKNLGGIYTYKLKLNDINNPEKNNNSTIIMKLLDNRDFVISFEIK